MTNNESGMGSFSIWHWIIVGLIFLFIWYVNKKPSNKQAKHGEPNNNHESKKQNAYEGGSDKSYYRVLGVLEDAEDIVIKAAYKALAQKYHPDKFDGDVKHAKACMQEINEAYAILSDPIERTKYDNERSKPKYEDDIAASRNVSQGSRAFTKTRMMNWIISLFYAVGGAFMLFQSNSFLGFIVITFFLGLFIGTFSLSAVALSPEEFSFLSMPIYISSKRRKSLQNVMLYLNVGLGLFGVIGVAMSIATAQYPMIISMLFYIIPPVINVRMLRLNR